MRSLICLLSLASLFLLGACGPAATPESGVDSTTAPLPTGSPPLIASNPMMETPSPASQNMVRLSIEHLSKRLGIPADRILLVEVTAVTWRDASLGCPKPGIDYIRVETPGYNILLEAGGNTYSYHTDEEKRVILCASRPPGDIFMTP